MDLFSLDTLKKLSVMAVMYFGVTEVVPRLGWMKTGLVLYLFIGCFAGAKYYKDNLSDVSGIQYLYFLVASMTLVFIWLPAGLYYSKQMYSFDPDDVEFEEIMEEEGEEGLE